METVSHHLLKELVLNNFGIGIVTKEYISEELDNKKLFEIKTNLSIPNKKLGYATLKNSLPNFSTLKFIKIFEE